MIDYSKNGRAAILRLDNPPLNVLTFELLDALVAAVEKANGDPAVGGIVIMGNNDLFTSGADINLFQSIKTPEEAIATSCRFQAAFDKVEHSSRPVVVALAGQVMGGALELAMAAHLRICTKTTRLSLPEVTLGIIPGAGGTQRLPRLVGIAAALDMLLSGRPVTAQDALDTGLVDAVCESGHLEAEAIKLLAATPAIAATSSRTDMISDASQNSLSIIAARKRAAAGRPEIIAPFMIIDAVETGITASFTAGCKVERKNFADCMQTTATRNKLRLFFTTKATAKIPEFANIAPHPVSTTAVIGCGSMGSGIAQAFATAGKFVLLLDTDILFAKKGFERIRESLLRKVERGTSTPSQTDAILSRISITEDWNALATTELVIEAVFEDRAIKRSLIEKIEQLCTPSTIIATNTSTISLDLLKSGMQHPERLVGIHFFNPAHSMPLVEVIRCTDTSPHIVSTAIDFTKELKKTPVLVNNSVGFVVNRLFVPYCIEAFSLIEEGASPEAIDTAMVDFGFPMGPLTLIDMTGIDILAFTGKEMRAAFPDHLPVPEIITSLVGSGMLGQKTGAGVYRYEPGNRTPLFNDKTADALRSVVDIKPRSFTGREITDRLVLRMVSEAFRLLEEKVALREQDIDVAMVLGTGFPDFRGGIIHYANDTGISAIVASLNTLAALCGKRYQPCNYLLSIH